MIRRDHQVQEVHDTRERGWYQYQGACVAALEPCCPVFDHHCASCIFRNLSSGIYRRVYRSDMPLMTMTRFRPSEIDFL